MFKKIKNFILKTTEKNPWFFYFWRKPLYEIYTDGSLKEGRGAWAYVVTQKGRLLRERAASHRQKTTCNRMEFQAAIEALQSLPAGSHAVVYTDSRILVKTMTLWRQEWKELGWVKKNGHPIPSLDQVQTLERLHQNLVLRWQWVKAHHGVPFNERCDELCRKARNLRA